IALLIALCTLPCLAPPPQASPPSPAATPEEAKIYEAFRAWITAQPAEIHRAGDEVVWERYRAELRRQGKSEKEAAGTIAALERIGDRAEVERWNRILTSPKPMFNTAPNAFLVAMTKGRKPGRSLDVGMGQGRDTIYLAQRDGNPSASTRRIARWRRRR